MLGKGNNFYNKKHTEESKRLIGLNNPKRKLTDNNKNIIKEMCKSGDYTQEKIGDLFNITQPHVSKISNNLKN